MRAAWAAAAVCAFSVSAAAKEKVCAIESAQPEPFVVDVAAQGGPTVKVYVQKIPVVIHPPVAADEPTKIEVRGALAFDGTAPALKIPIKPKSFVDASNGMVRLAPGTEGLAVRVRGKWAIADVTLGDVKLRELFLPCEVLTADAVTRTEPQLAHDSDEDVWVAAQKILHLRHDAGSGPTLEVELLGDLQSLDLHPTEHRGAWIRVRSRWPDGTTLTGWANVKELARPKPRGHELGDVYFAAQQKAAACEAAPAANASAPEAGVQLVEAKLAPGTPVLADRLFQWATARGGDVLKIKLRERDSWAQIVGAAGVGDVVTDCPEKSTVLGDAWVPRVSVQLPSAPDGGAPSK